MKLKLQIPKKPLPLDLKTMKMVIPIEVHIIKGKGLYRIFSGVQRSKVMKSLGRKTIIARNIHTNKIFRVSISKLRWRPFLKAKTEWYKI